MLMAIDSTRQGMLAPDGSLLPFTAAREWFALIVRPMKEMDTADWLKDRDFAAYWPNSISNEATSRGVAGARLVRRPRPKAVIPGYIFLGTHLGSPEPFAVMHDAPGVYGWLRTTGGGPLRVGEADIQTIREIEAGQNIPPPVGAMHSFRSGEKVRICDDTYGLWETGIVKGVALDGRIIVDVPGLLGRVTPVHFHPHQLEPLQAAQAKPKKKAR
jgi:transcription antitermination factor NusG